MHRWIFGVLALLLFVPQTEAAKIYRWVDDDGNVVFSDKPREGAELITIGKPTIVPHQRVPAPEEDAPVPTALEEVPYDIVAIASPPHDATLRNEPLTEVTVAVAPPLQTQFGHKIQLYLDGEAAGPPQTSTQFVIENVYRGTHELVAAIVDGAGQELARSDASVFHMHRTSILAPQSRARRSR